MTITKLPPTVCCADCGEPSSVHLMRHYWDRSICLLCETELQKKEENK